MGPKKAQPKAKVAKRMAAARNAFYSFQVKELTRHIGTLRSYSTQLEGENDDLRKEIESLDTDRSDVISLLKRRLSDKNEEIKQLTERSDALQEAKDAEKKFLKNLIKKNEHEYKTTTEQLVSEIKLLHGKLNSLEEFKVNRDELMGKFAVQEEALEEQERRHKRTLYEVEKKFIISKDKLRKDMEEKLLKLSLDFQKATQTKIASTTQSVIRENIAINNELQLLIGSWQKLFEENENLKGQTKCLTNQIDIATNQKGMALERNAIQSQVIERLAYDHRQVMDSYRELEQYKKKIKALEDCMAVLEKAAACAEQEAGKIKQERESIVAKLKAKTREFNRLCSRNHIVEKKMKIALMTIRQMIGLDERSKKGVVLPEDELHEREFLLKALLEILDCDDLLSSPRHELRDISVETIVSIDNKAKYSRGDLGVSSKGKSLRPELTSEEEIYKFLKQ